MFTSVYEFIYVSIYVCICGSGSGYQINLLHGIYTGIAVLWQQYIPMTDCINYKPQNIILF